jgi:hypothetical protein
LLTTGEAANLLATEYGIVLSQRTVIRYCDKGVIVCTKSAGGFDRRISPEALRAFAQTYYR